MAVRTGRQFIEGLRDGREVWYDGRRVDDVTTFAPFQPSIAALAGLYDLQHDARYREILSVDCPALGERIARAFEMPRTREHLRLKREAYRIWAEASCGMMGRSPDFLNVMMTALAAKPRFFAEFAPARADAVLNYYRHVARRDLFLTHALLDPQLDKSKLRHQQDEPDLCLRVVERNAEGLVLSGIKRIATAAPYADEILVWPFPPSFQPGEEAYANVFAIPMNSKGLKTLCRPSFAHPAARRDHPLSARFDEMDATCVFDHVLVPWDRVFLHEDIRFLNRMYQETRMRELTAHQTNVRLEVKMGFVYAVLVRMAEVSGLGSRPDMMELLGEAVACVEVIRSTTRSAEAQATADPDNDLLYPDLFALQVGRAFGPVFYPKLVAMLRRLGGGGLIQMPVHLAEFDSPIGKDLERSLRGANGISGLDKAQLFKLAWDLCGTEFGARHELYEMNYAGERSALLAGMQREYGRKQHYLDHLDRFMEAL
ncbi:MAG TPA: 4-hydroxyphenylacetate 3-hydroxylase N-terminal domain-containing protein [Gammaproteobacteria bacterium]|nr:4-hydroxyphenylacetate 3-hydroxylase N-terminal domain-containing protein [Gammaproteobacteria bacterium]